MHVCPGCTRRCIGFWQKQRASSTFPAVCTRCGASLHIPDSIHTGSLVLFEVLLWGSILLAVHLRTWGPLLAAPAGALLWTVSVDRWARLTAIEAAKVKDNLRSALVKLVILAAFILAAYLFFGQR